MVGGSGIVEQSFHVLDSCIAIKGDYIFTSRGAILKDEHFARAFAAEIKQFIACTT
jgi:hypothetical protein